jgi:hypothetical protein
MICLLSLGRILRRRLGPFGGDWPAPETLLGCGLAAEPSVVSCGVRVDGGSGGDEKRRNELSDCLGAFHGNRRKVMQQ